jgi:hypothetical protein
MRKNLLRPARSTGVIDFYSFKGLRLQRSPLTIEKLSLGAEKSPCEFNREKLYIRRSRGIAQQFIFSLTGSASRQAKMHLCKASAGTLHTLRAALF